MKGVPMKIRLAIVVWFVFLLSCGGPYKALKPKPEPSPGQLGYIEISDKGKSFKLKPGKKYYIQFPGPRSADQYLVLRTAQLDAIDAYLTAHFTNGKTPMTPLPDQTPPVDDYQAYAVEAAVPTYYWVIEDVRREVLLRLEYRYVQRWRFEFEQESEAFLAALHTNTIDRTSFEAIGNTLSPDDLDLDQLQKDLEQKSERITTLSNRLEKIEAVFPANIKNSDDKAYLDFMGLKQSLQKEAEFQQSYGLVLDVFSKERTSRGNTEQFVSAIPTFTTFFSQKNNYPESVQNAVRSVLAKRLPELPDYYRDLLNRKSDSAPINLPEGVEDLFKECNTPMGSSFSSMVSFMRNYNRAAADIAAVKSDHQSLQEGLRAGEGWPDNAFYRNLHARALELKKRIPTVRLRDFGSYATTPGAKALEREARDLRTRVGKTEQQLRRAADLVPKINRFKGQGNYQAIVRALRSNADIDFLRERYKGVDKLSIEQQEKAIRRAIRNQGWVAAETALQNLHEDRNFLNPGAVSGLKRSTVRRLENELISAIEAASRKRAEAFIEANKTNVNNVEALYSNPAFRPVHELTFSSGGGQELQAAKNRIKNYLNDLKTELFPREAIRTIYTAFSRNIRDNGVAKARAIIIHGKHYQGKNRKIRQLIAEVDPMIAKWITKPKTYRKIYAAPVNPTQQDQNEYVFRLNIRIPSEAKFPVFDINIKLPREVAKAAATEQWYDQITMNGKVLKNEGRFRITAPTKSNNYECQITPVQMRKNQDNILEVRFKHEAFKILEISVMAQRPIIKKN